MKPICFALVGILLQAQVALAESLAPEDVVRALVHAVHDNDLRGVLVTADLVAIANHPANAQKPQQVIRLLGQLDGREILLTNEGRHGWPESALVMMTTPIRMSFDLILVKATPEIQEDRYVVVAIHP